MEEEFLTCSICYDVFNEPKTLSCLHRFCGKCLHHYITSQKRSTLVKIGGFYCPVCREVIKSPDPHKEPSEWTDLLKTDFHLTSLIRFVEEKRASNNVSREATLSIKPQHPCSNHKHKELDLYCVDCQSAICHLCAGISHRSCTDVTTLKDVSSKQKIVMQKSLKQIEKSIENIELAREKGLNRIEKLKSDRELDIKKLANDWHIAVKNEEERLLTSLENYCAKIYEKIMPQLTEFDAKTSVFKKKAISFLKGSHVMSDFDALNSISNMTELNTLDLSSYSNIAVGLDNVDFKLKINSRPSIRFGDLMIETNTNKVTVVNTSTSLEVTNEPGLAKAHRTDDEFVPYSNEYNNNQNDNPFQNLRDETSKLSLKQAISAKISKIVPSQFPPRATKPHEHTRQPPPIPPRHKPRGSSTPSIIPRYSSGEYTDATPVIPQLKNSTSVNPSTTVQKLRIIDTRFRQDKCEPKIRDIIVTKQGMAIIITDWANQSVKAFFVRRDKDTRLEVGGRPWSITQLSDTLAAVSLPLSRQICILKITSPLTMQNSFVAAKNYSGLATLNTQLLVASGGSDPPSVDIINLYGEVLKSFHTSPDNTPLFQYPAYVCVTSAMHILVSDKKQGAIVCLSHTGDVLFKFQPRAPRNLQEPCGLCTTSSGQVMVLEARGLLQLTPRGQHDRPLLRKADGHVVDPKGIAIDSDGLLYITNDEHEVTVFKING